jgi:hypothetical protein
MATQPNQLYNLFAHPRPNPASINPIGALGRAGAFLGNLSHKTNVETQAEYMAKALRAHGIPGQDAWDSAHQYAQENDIFRGSQQGPAVQQLLAILAAIQHQHRG